MINIINVIVNLSSLGHTITGYSESAILRMFSARHRDAYL
jgi:hypothetical protein